MSTEKRHLLYVVALATVLRLFVFLTTPLVGADCYSFFNVARLLATGEPYRDQTVHPLYPALYAIASLVTGEYETAGKGVSLILGVLTLLPLYFLSRSLFGHTAAIFSTFFLAVNPTHVRLSADIISDTTYVFFIVMSIWIACEVIRRQSYSFCALLALCVGLSYFTRAEGIGLLVVIVPWLLLAHHGKVKERLLMGTSYLLVFVFVLALPVIPYLASIHRQLGYWHLSMQLAAIQTTKHSEVPVPNPETYKEKRGTGTMGKTEAARLSGWRQKGQYHMIALYVCNEFVKVLYYPVLPFLLIGFFTMRPPQRVDSRGALRYALSYLGTLRPRFIYSTGRGEILILAFIFVYFVTFCYFAYVNYYMSGRYVLPLAVLSLVWVGAGFQYTSEYISRAIPSLQPSSVLFNRAALLLVVLVLLVTLPKDLTVKRGHELSQREAGLWIREHLPAQTPVIMGLEKVAFYAQGKWISLGIHNYDSIVWYCDKGKVNYLAIYGDTFSENPEIMTRIENAGYFALAKEWKDRVGEKERRLLLYQYVGPTSSD